MLPVFRSLIFLRIWQLQCFVWCNEWQRLVEVRFPTVLYAVKLNVLFRVLSETITGGLLMMFDWTFFSFVGSGERIDKTVRYWPIFRIKFFELEEELTSAIGVKIVLGMVRFRNKKGWNELVNRRTFQMKFYDLANSDQFCDDVSGTKEDQKDSKENREVWMCVMFVFLLSFCKMAHEINFEFNL